MATKAQIDQREKGGWGGKRALGESWDEFDALPVQVKWLFWRAPYNYSAIEAVRCMRRGGDVIANIPRQIESMRRDLRREVLRLYGPHHPQAQGKSK